jgi:glycosyltransferase involved in cell wall biosynthesis
VWPEKSIVYYCGRGLEKWDPTSLEQGIGGSETAVIMLAKEWKKLGYSVTVYGYPKKEGLYEGVDYKFHWRFNHQDEFDILIGWRNELLFKYPIKARKKLLDLHDVVNQSDYPPELVEKIDVIMAKSHYHKSFLPDVTKQKIHVISNGIEVAPSTIKSNPFLISYCSSYDRGLEYLLKMWPDVRQKFPQAQLKIAYGWNNFEVVYKGNPERMAWKKRMEDLMKQEGVMHLGRISKQEVLNLHAEAGICAYYCTFEEINCITVLEAQAMGALPLTTAFAALQETNHFGILVAGDPYDPATKKRYLDKLLETIGSKYLKNYIRHRQAYNQSEIHKGYAWSVIAKKWQRVFHEA